MCRDKLLSSNSCTANFQLYTQMALRLEENGVRGGGGGRMVVDFCVCLAGRVRGIPHPHPKRQDNTSKTRLPISNPNSGLVVVV